MSEIHNILLSMPDQEIPKVFNQLSSDEQLLIYYLFRASVYGNTIVAQQLHRYAQSHIDLFKVLMKYSDTIKSMDTGFNCEQFLKQVESYYVYIWANHGQYFVREHANAKRCPSNFGLNLLTQQNISNVIKNLNIESIINNLNSEDYCKSLFDPTFESTLTVTNSIDNSAINIYSRNFTDEDYSKLSLADKNKINNTFSKDASGKITVEPYYIHGRTGPELSKAVYWLHKSFEHVKQVRETGSKVFDEYILKSLEYMIKFLETGDEEYFKKHSVEWLKSNNKVDYNFGFVEQYDDPYCIRGFFQADITVRTLNIDKIKEILPAIEMNLPYPDEFKRDLSSNSVVMNASINRKMFGAGHLGPIFCTAAYCLPNYDEIRQSVGSKQIIYPSDKSIGETVNAELAPLLTYSSDIVAWSKKNDPTYQLGRDIWNAQCILHETIGHGSGKLGVTSNGVQVTSDNAAELIPEYSAIEEMRAEILALYVSIFNLDQILDAGLLTEWLNVMTKDELEDRLILGMLTTGLTRIKQQRAGSTEIKGAHALANSTIMNYVIDGKGVTVVEEEIYVNDKSFIVPSVKILNKKLAKQSITDLLIEVQRIKSTGDGPASNKLIDQYGRKLYKSNYVELLQNNQKEIMGDVLAQVALFPIYQLNNDNGVELKVPSNVLEFIRTLDGLM
jgi:dipeptidyl-peptidase-3